ncbi:MAG: PstS family phosphate ABC transporter substrate-binding protein [Verrucomicrobiales bacterium]
MRTSWMTSLVLVFCIAGLRGEDGENPGAAAEVSPIRIQGSDTMLQLNLSFAQALKKEDPQQSLVVRGEGSSAGFRALITGEADIAASSRPIKESELAKLKEKRGLVAQEIVVAFDPIAVFVHKDNPIDSVTVSELRELYTTEGMTNRWEDLGRTVGGEERASGAIHRLGRSPSSGTYGAFLKMITAGNRAKFRGEITKPAGSKALVEAVSQDPLAIGYSAAAYKTEGVKFLKIKPEQEDAEPVAPTPEIVRAGKYPLTGKLYYYTAGEAEGELKGFIDWLKTNEAKAQIRAQRLVAP